MIDFFGIGAKKTITSWIVNMNALKTILRGLRYTARFFFRAIRLASLGATIKDSYRLFLCMVTLAYRRGVGKGATCKEICVHLRFKDHMFPFYITSLFDLRILKDIFIDREYDINLPDSANVIFDLGANIGASAVYFSILYPKATVYAFEPDQNAQGQLKKNIESFRNIQWYPYAVADSDASITFYGSDARSESSSLIQRGTDARAYSVEGKTIDSLMKELRIEYIDILKFDIEGGEERVFSSFNNFEHIRHIVGEVHLDLISLSEDQFLSLFHTFAIAKKRLSPLRFIFAATTKQ